MCIAGGVDIPDDMIDKSVISFENYPEDELSIYILQLIGLHLKNMSDENKLKIIATLREILGIRPLKRVIPLCDEDCTRCSGEYCETHFDKPCDCDVVERHRAQNVDTGLERPTGPDLGGELPTPHQT